MPETALELGALGEAVVFLNHFRDLPDPRQAGKVLYPLQEVLPLSLLAVLAGAETFVDIARFGQKKLDLLRRFRPFRGTPSHDHLGDIYATLDAERLQHCFVAWVAALTGASGDVIAIDGKRVRRSYQKKGAKAPVHVVSALTARQRLVVGQIKVAEKSNEIVAIPKPLELLAIEGAIASIDAIGGAVALYQSQGSITFKPQSEKSSTLRVAKDARQDRTMAAIRASDSDIGRPAWRRFAAMFAYSRAAELSKGSTRAARS
jgi:predicted transposase YbfD/YdcC